MPTTAPGGGQVGVAYEEGQERPRDHGEDEKEDLMAITIDGDK